MIAFCDSIASVGLIAGGLAGRSKRANCRFSIMDWRLAKPEDFISPHRFNGPQKVPFKPRERCDAIYFFNLKAIQDCGSDPRQGTLCKNIPLKKGSFLAS